MEVSDDSMVTSVTNVGTNRLIEVDAISPSHSIAISLNIINVMTSTDSKLIIYLPPYVIESNTFDGNSCGGGVMSDCVLTTTTT
jgi:hypothetical protein